MRRQRRDRASAVWSREWLLAADVPPAVAASTCADVQDRLDDLPDLLRGGAGMADTLLGMLPESALRRAARLPGVSQFAGIVESLTAVSYFDTVTGDAVLPAQRRPVPSPEPSLESHA